MSKNNFIYHILRIICTPIFKLWYNPKIINREVIPKDEPFIVCGNHRHFMDQFPVIISTKRTIHWLSKKEYFDGKFKFFFKSVGCIKVDRSIHDGSAKKKALKYLNRNEAIGLFPEGTRNKTNKDLLEFKKGAVRMAKEANVVIIPFAITGKFCFRSSDLTLRFGKPFYVNDTEDDEIATERLRKTILKLKKYK